MQYLRWLNNISPIGFERQADGTLGNFAWWKGTDLGTSFRYGRPVTDMIAERLPITLLLNLISIPLIYALAIGIGVQAARQRGGRFDVTSNIFLLGLWSVPSMLAGVLFIGFFASEQYWRWFPTGGLMRRETADQTFLPLLGGFGDVMITAICVAVLTVVFISAAVSFSLKSRQWTGLIIGSCLGYAMAFNLEGQIFGLLHLLLIPSMAWLVRVLAGLNNVALRLVVTGAFAVGFGLAVAGLFGVEMLQTGYLLDRIWHLVLPVIALSYGGLAFLAKLTRSSLLENLAADYARTARAKGVDEETVLWRHVFRNSLLPLITVSATLLPSLLAGSVIVESIFSIDGMGKLAVEAVQTRDRELVLSVTLISGLLTLVGYLLADIAYAIVDPRVSYD